MVLLKACEVLQHKVKKDLENSLMDQLFKIGNNETYLHKSLNINKKNNKKSRKKEWLNKDSKCKNPNTKAAITITSSN